MVKKHYRTSQYKRKNSKRIEINDRILKEHKEQTNNKLFTIENVNKAILKIESINTPDIKKAYKQVRLAFSSLGMLPALSVQIPEGQQICRARTHHKFTFYKKIKDISAPPFNRIKTFARCNKPFQSMFYGSEIRPISYMELADYWLVKKSRRPTFCNNW